MPSGRRGLVLLLLLALAGCAAGAGGGDRAATGAPPLAQSAAPPPDPSPPLNLALRVDPAVTQPGATVTLHIDAPDPFAVSTGATAQLDQWDGATWNPTYVLPTVQTNLTDKIAPIPWRESSQTPILAIAYDATRQLVSKVPPVEPGTYRIQKHVRLETGNDPNTPEDVTLYARVTIGQ
jgi:hypothetical protein